MAKKAAAKAAKAKIAKAAPKKPAIVSIIPALPVEKPPVSTYNDGEPFPVATETVATPPAPDVADYVAHVKRLNEEIVKLRLELGGLPKAVVELRAWQKKVDADIQWLKDRSRP